MTIPHQPSSASYNWNISLQAGGKLLPIGQRLSLDGNHFVALFKHQIKVYHLATRQCIKTIAIDLSNLNIVDSQILELNPDFIYIFDRQGEVVVVNWREKLANSIISRTKISLFDTNSILKIISFNPDTFETLAVCGRFLPSKTSPRLAHICKLNKETSQELLSIKSVLIFKSSTNNFNIIFLNNNNEIILVTIKDGSIERTLTFPFVFKSKITCIAASNDGETIALGTTNGIIQLIYSNNLEKPQRLLKWHIDQVKSLEFNLDNSYLLSGGVEKVLVFWQLDTDKQQFLPRLNGIIENISIDPKVSELYTISLNVNDSNDLEFLVLNSSDLISRLTVDGLRPNFNLGNLNKLQKKLANTISDIKNDLTCSIAINPLTNHLYLPNGSSIQVYDYRKDEQLFIQTAVSTSQTGKVKSEQLILDPKVEILKFTEDGKWMCTFDSVPTPELDNLLSTKDIHYSLKFWKYIESAKDPKQSYWELSTKIIDPHGVKTPIVSITPAPKSHHSGLAFLTADTKGGIRLWRPRIPKEIYNKGSTNNEKLQQTAWILKKSFSGNGRFETNSVSLSWSQDSSIIIIGYENLMNLIDCNTFKEIDDFHLPSLLGSRVRSVNIIDNNVVALAKNRIISYDLLNAKNNELCGKIQTPTNGKNLIAVNTNSNLIALVVNFFNKTKINSKIFIFKPQSLKPVYIGHHEQYISSITFSPSSDSFVFVDVDSRVGIVSSTIQEDLILQEDLDYAYELNLLLNSAKERAINNRSGGKSQQQHEDMDGDIDIDIAEEGEVIHGKTLNPHTFEQILENTEGVQLESLFDRIMNVL